LADGVMLNGVSPRSIGRGGTNIAHADNGAILYDNPAAAVNIEGCTLVDIGVDMLICDFHYSGTNATANEAGNLFPLPQISMIKKSRDGRMAYGLGLFVPAGFSELYDMQGPVALGGQQRYKSIGSLAKILPTLAYKLNDRLSVGATLGVAVSHDEIEGPYRIQGPGPFTGVASLIDLQATGAAMCWSLGLQYELSDYTTLGITYQSESRFKAEGNTTVNVPGFGMTRYDSQLSITWPRSLGLGIKHELCPCRTLSVDLIWFNWSNAFDTLGMELTNSSNIIFPNMVEELPLRWRDTLSTRLGYEQKLGCDRVVRCGYVYHRNPIPDGTLTPYIQSILEHSFTAGYGWKFRGWDIDLAYLFAFGSNRHVGTSDLVGGDYSNSFHRAQVHDISFSFMRQF
jgi:long-subunit fatty acid transport protein